MHFFGRENSERNPRKGFFFGWFTGYFSFETIRFWVNEFKFGKISIEDISRSGGPKKTVSNGSNEEASRGYKRLFWGLRKNLLAERYGFRGDYIEKYFMKLKLFNIKWNSSNHSRMSRL